MTLKIYLFQACVWLLPLLLGVTTVAFIRESSFVWLRLCVAAAANVLFSAGLEIFHACALRQKATGLKVAWFVDEEAVDFSVLFSPQVMDILLPRRSWLSTGWCCVWSGCLGGLAAQLLEPRDLAERLQLDWACTGGVLATGGLHQRQTHVSDTYAEGARRKGRLW
ncbi:unnamed protein product [Durusdinium trenchii]|uniref:Uncharacterized protein n=1 Tax=Durusdinium trenchii TaxID=1381693 RepID=A0ABP0RGI6_9DINO